MRICTRAGRWTAGTVIAGAIVLGLLPRAALASESADPAPQREADEPTKQVRGRVLMQSDGKPVPDADVRLVTWTDHHRHYDLKKTRSDKEGEFSFDGIGRGEHRLAAFFEDFSSRKSLYAGEDVDLSSETPVTLTLVKMPSISVHVVSKADSKPIHEAVVKLIWTDTQHDTPTDVNGNVLLRALTHEVWNVRALAKGFAQQTQDVNLNNTESANITFELEPGGVLFGTIKDETGNSLKDVGVSISPANHVGGETDYIASPADGKYRFEHVPLNQKLELSLSKDGYLDDNQEIVLAAAPDVEREINLVLKQRPDGGSVRGTVTDAEGKPIVGATIGNEGRRSSDIRSATTDEHGQFLLDNVYERSGGHEMIVKVKGFAPRQLTFSPGTKEKPAEMEIMLQHGHHIRGHVVDEAGASIAGVAIYYADAQHGGGVAFGGSAKTDSEGRFKVDSLPDNCPFDFQKGGYSEIEDETLPLDGADEVTVRMMPEGVIKGQVSDAVTEKPISPFNVQITFSPDRQQGDPGHHLSGARATSRDGERFANPEGSFLLKGLVRGMPLQVTVTAEGYERKVERRVLAESMNEAGIIEFRLAPLDPTAVFTVRGRLVDQQDQPVAGVELRLISVAEATSKTNRRTPSFVDFPFGWQMIRSDQTKQVAGVRQVLQATSGEEGGFTFEDVRPAAGAEIVYWGGGISQGRLNDIGRFSIEELGKVTIKTVAAGTIRGTIDRKSLPGVTRISVRSTSRSMDIDMDYHDADISANDSAYEIRNVPPGTHQVEVDGERIPSNGTGGFTYKILQQHRVEIRSGETVTLDMKDETAP